MNKLYTISDAADYSGQSESKVRRAANSGDLAGQIVAGTYIFSEKAVNGWMLGLEIVTHKLLTVNTASRDYHVSRNRLYSLIRAGTLPATKIKSRGSLGWAYVFYESDLEAVGKGLDRVSSGPAVKDDIDQRLERSNGSWAIRGTKNKSGKPFAYRSKNQARRRAREAYSEPLLFRAGDSVFIRPTDTYDPLLVDFILVEDVTWIDKSILTKYKNGKPVLMPIRWLRSKK